MDWTYCTFLVNSINQMFVTFNLGFIAQCCKYEKRWKLPTNSWNIYCKLCHVDRISLESMTINDLSMLLRTCAEREVKLLMRLRFSSVTWTTGTRKCSTTNLFKAVADKLTDLESVWTSELVEQRGGRKLLKQLYLWKPAGRRHLFYLAAWLLLITHLTRCRVQQQTSVSSV